jgi:hypothetical protein
MGAIKKLAFVAALAAAGAVVAKKVMGSSSENAWESAGGWDSGSTDWSRAPGDAASSTAASVADKVEQATEQASDAVDDAASEAAEQAEAVHEHTEQVVDAAEQAADKT